MLLASAHTIDILVLILTAALILIALWMSWGRESERKVRWKKVAIFVAYPFLISLLIVFFRPRTVYITVLISAAVFILFALVMRWKRHEPGHKAFWGSSAFYLGGAFFIPLLIFLFGRSPSPWWLLIGAIFVTMSLWPLLATIARDVVPLDYCPVLQSANAKGLRVAHLSDLHICAEKTMEGGLSAQDVLRAAREALHWAMGSSPRLVILTGDVTDSGLEPEWAELEQILADLTPEQRDKIVVIPGNHDLSITLEAFLPTRGEQVLDFENRCIHFAHHVFENAPAHWNVFLSPTSELPLREFLKRVDDYRNAYEQDPPRLGDNLEVLSSRLTQMARAIRGDLSEFTPLTHRHTTHPWRLRSLDEYTPPVVLPRSLLTEANKDRQVPWPTADLPLVQDLLFLAFPIIVHEDEQHVVVALNSNTIPAYSVIDGAIGTLGERQLRQLKALLRSRAGKCVVVLIHHHLGCPRQILRENPLSQLELRVLQLNEAKRMCDILAEHKPAVVLHGHKHIDYRATYRGVTILSAASVAYGDRLSGENCHVYNIEANGRVSLVASTRIVSSCPSGRPA